MEHPLQPAYDMYAEKLEALIVEEIKIKKMLNEFASEMKIQIPFPNISESLVASRGVVIKDDEFVGKSYSLAVGLFLEKKGESAKWEEIIEALKKGGFDWNKEGSAKEIRDNLVKNTFKFKYIKANNAFGLKKWYNNDTPDNRGRKKEKKEKLDNSENDAKEQNSEDLSEIVGE